MIFWRPAAPLHSAVWFDSGSASPGRPVVGNSPERDARLERFVELTTRYQERSPLDPLSGTTRKRNYRSQVSLLEISSSEIASEKAWFEFSGWVLEDSLFRGPGAPDSLWFIGGENHDYAGPERALYFADGAGRVRMVAPGGQVASANPAPAGGGPGGASAEVDRPVLKRAVPSPSGRLLALLEEGPADSVASGATVQMRLRLVAVHRGPLSKPAEFTPSPAAGETPGVAGALREIGSAAFSGSLLGGPRWAPDDSGVYLETETGVLRLAAAANAASGLRKASRYPACLEPVTSSGGAISPNGRRLYFDDQAGRYRVITEAPGAYSVFVRTSWREASASSGGTDCP